MGILSQCSNFDWYTNALFLTQEVNESYQNAKSTTSTILEKNVEELDQRNMGNGLNAKRILDRIKQSNDEVEQMLITKFGSQQHSLATGSSAVVHNTFLNTGTTLSPPSIVNPPEIPLLSTEDGIWGHYWENKIMLLPQLFRFPHKKTLLSLWLS